ncbi:HK97 family phage prohead protease [Sphingobium sp. CFD-1]|uniref:HK97 family phage prohead protease n=1 Tax=Sphingobium sp. CFD-1 TaxID=2878545 RepID=UPI00214CBBA7|nr:HK97 family phage prohead protease [Sphingobium sp. CFD-1]
MTVKTETRLLTGCPELRATDTGRTLVGYAAVFNSPTDIGDAWTEVFLPGAFHRSFNDSICALIAHDRSRVLGRVGAGTLRLSEDSHGLRYEIDLPDTTDGRDLAVSVERGDITGMSFGFTATRQMWDDTANPPKRTISEAALLEVTVTAFPAYPDTSVGLRSLDEARQERRDHPAKRRIDARRATMEQKFRGI